MIIGITIGLLTLGAYAVGYMRGALDVAKKIKNKKEEPVNTEYDDINKASKGMHL